MMRTAGLFGGLNGADLCCAERDALALRRILASSRGVIRRPDDALVLRGNALTRGAVDGFLSWAVRADLDLVVFYVSGHGNRHGFALAGGDFYRFAELRDWFAYLDSLGTKVIAIFDTCQAGALVDLFKSGAALEGLDHEQLELSWLQLIASAGSGVRAYGAVSASHVAYEAPRLGHGRFTAELLRALRKNRGSIVGDVGRFVSDIDAFTTALIALVAKYWNAAPEHVGGMDPVPLVAADVNHVFGEATFDLSTRGVQLDIRASVVQRRYLPTKLCATFVTATGQVLQHFEDRVLPRYAASIFRRTVRANVLLAAVSVPAIYSRQLLWRVWAEDERGRVVGEARPRPLRLPEPRRTRFVIPRGW